MGDDGRLENQDMQTMPPHPDFVALPGALLRRSAILSICWSGTECTIELQHGFTHVFVFSSVKERNSTLHQILEQGLDFTSDKR